MSFVIEQKYIEDVKNFSYDHWRAVSITKEQRKGNDYYFAQIVKYYGNGPDSYDYDIGNNSSEFAYIGRKEEYVGIRGPDTDPESKTFGKRITYPAETRVDTYIDHGVEKIRTVLVKGKKIYVFTLPVNTENTSNIKKLIGPVSITKQTTFKMLTGTQNPISVTEEVFFNNTVDEIMTQHYNLLSKSKKSNTTK